MLKISIVSAQTAVSLRQISGLKWAHYTVALEVFKLFRVHADIHLYSALDALINGKKTLQVTWTGMTGENRAAHHLLRNPQFHARLMFHSFTTFSGLLFSFLLLSVFLFSFEFPCHLVKVFFFSPSIFPPDTWSIQLTRTQLAHLIVAIF